MTVLTQLVNLPRTALDQLVQLPLLLNESRQLLIYVKVHWTAPVHNTSEQQNRINATTNIAQHIKLTRETKIIRTEENNKLSLRSEQ